MLIRAGMLIGSRRSGSFQYESFLTTLPSRKVHRSQPRTSSRWPSVVVPRSVHSEAPRSPATKWSSSW